ncbi:U11/U12 small nuclear ribonucleoprotein 31 kDa protein [Rutidosis leptorrhynchoides]|uniref:U11/U12 small nuclear ribonucleoprotein 31 kDa protein n=1 Tax=Rutidosis leptorrhynchoides TaxID=125765 RepID=UPI003A98FF28
MGRYSDEDEDDTFYHRYSSVTPQQQPSSSTSSNKTLTKSSSNRGSASGSGGLAPSKSTVYVSNLDYSLTNSDVFTIFSTFGKVAKVTILRDRVSRESRGVAFVLFVSRDDAMKAVKGIDKKVLNGRTLSASIASDNGRAPEFIKKKVYKDKSRCYECGEGGHLSYECPKNQFGVRERPQPKRGRREGGSGGGGGRGGGYVGGKEEEEDEAGGDEVFEDDNWASIVDNEADERLLGGGENGSRDGKGKKEKVKKTSYFSDESDKED